MYTTAFMFMGIVSSTYASGLKSVANLGESASSKVATQLLENVTETKEVKRGVKRIRGVEGYSKRFFNRSIPISMDVRRAKGLCFEIPKNMKGLPISNDPDFPLFARYGRNPEFLPKLYTALTHYTGPSDKHFDSYKGSFSFQFMVDVEKKKQQSEYIFWLMQFRSFMRVKLYQIVPESDPRREEVFTKATESLFSEDDIIAFSFGFVEDLLSRLDADKVTPNPFVLCSYSDCLIYGYLDGKYFSEEFKEYDEFTARLKELQSKIKTEAPNLETEEPKKGKE